MRALAVALLLSVPLTAGDKSKSSLEKAVELFKSPDAGQRAAGSRLAERELRRLLAPLLAAMEAEDPEVRRRARRAVLSLVPPEDEGEVTQQQESRAEVLARRDAARVRAWRRRQQKAVQLLAGFGIEGTPQRLALRGGACHLSGFRVLSLRQESRAARLGLRKGDLMLHLNGQAVTRALDFPRIVGAEPDWSRVTASLWRDGRLVRLPKK